MLRKPVFPPDPRPQEKKYSETLEKFSLKQIPDMGKKKSMLAKFGRFLWHLANFYKNLHCKSLPAPTIFKSYINAKYFHLKNYSYLFNF